MNAFSRPFYKLLVTATVGCSLAIACSDDGLEKRYPVTGMVNYQGKPLEKGVINFVPDKPDGRSATGSIKDGYYSLTTLSPEDGAFAGTYKVTIVAKTADMAQAEAEGKAKGAKSAMIPQDMIVKAYRKAKNAVPEKYSTVGTSNLTAEVKAETNKIPFDLAD